MTEFGCKIVSIVLCVAMIIAFAVIIISVNKTTFNEDNYTVKTIYVEEGDTLYKYYNRYADQKTNPNDYCDAIKKLNNLKSSMIYANTTLKVYVAIGD